jgi:hypothetical protein
MIIGTGIFATFYGGNITYALFYLSLITPVVCYLYTFYVYLRLKMYQNIGKRTVVKGEVTDFNFQIANEDVIPYQNVKVDFYHDKSRILDSDEEKEYRLLPGEIQSVDTSICCKYMGEYYIGAKTVTITDFLYLFTITYSVISKMKVWVLPRIVSLSNVKMISINPDSKRSAHYLKNDEEQVDVEVRKYVPGDSKKMIHWKTSSKRQELYTRKSISIPKTGVILYMDLWKIEEDELSTVIIKDKIVESTLAIANYCVSRNIPCEIYYEQVGIKNELILNQYDLDDFYLGCPKFRFQAQKQIDEVIAESYNQAMYNASCNQCIVVTHDISDRLYKVVPQLLSCQSDCGIIFINKEMSKETNYIIKLLIETGADVSIVNLNDEIEDVL